MARATQWPHPIETLREAATSLEASVLLCLAKPGPAQVHRLRTTTRRIEARLQLLSMLPDLPPHQSQQTGALHLLKQVRRATGRVRDIDVQRNLVRGEVAANQTSSRPDHHLQAEARHLYRELRHKRDQEVDRLLRLLHKQRAQLPLVIEELLKALAPAESMTLTAARQTALVREWYGQPRLDQPAPQDPAELHAIRKRAKLARYMAESAPQSSVAIRRLTARLERLQRAGGEWHDWLGLAQVAAHELGDSAKLTRRFAAHAQRCLRVFQRRLNQPV